MGSRRIIVLCFTVLFLLGSKSSASELDPILGTENTSDESDCPQNSCLKLIKNIQECQKYEENIRANENFLNFFEQPAEIYILCSTAYLFLMQTRLSHIHLLIFSGLIFSDGGIRCKIYFSKFKIKQLKIEKNSILKPASAKNFLGECYESGKLINLNPQSAAELYQSAAATNNLRAIYNLARCHRDGIGNIKLDKNEAIRLFKKSGKIGEKEFQRLTSMEDSEGLKECLICLEIIWTPINERYDHTCGKSFHAFCLKGWGERKPCVNCNEKIDFEP